MRTILLTLPVNNLTKLLLTEVQTVWIQTLHDTLKCIQDFTVSSHPRTGSSNNWIRIVKRLFNQRQLLYASLINRKWHLFWIIHLKDQKLKIAELNIQLQSKSATQKPRRWYSVCCWWCHSRLSSAVFVGSWESCIHTTRTQTPSQLKVKWVITFRAPQQGAPHPPNSNCSQLKSCTKTRVSILFWAKNSRPLSVLRTFTFRRVKYKAAKSSSCLQIVVGFYRTGLETGRQISKQKWH